MRRTPAIHQMTNLLLCGLLSATVTLIGCSSDPKPEPEPTDDTAAQDAGGVDGTVGDGGAKIPDVTADTAVLQDAVADASTAPDTFEEPDLGQPPVKCTSDVYCESFYGAALPPCKKAVCNLDTGKCGQVHKVGTCCADKDCDDKVDLTVDKCDLASNTCQNVLQPGDCPTKEIVLDMGFEQNSLQGFTTTEGPKNGNVNWHIDTARARAGKHAIYLGNPCYSYDNSQTAANECKAGVGETVFSSLLTPSKTLPQGKQSVAHFWVWIQAEPMLTDTVKDASGKIIKQGLAESKSCKPDCEAGHTCVSLPATGETCTPGCGSGQICQGGKCISSAQCLPENDVLLVYVDVEGENSAVAWDSTTVGKSTKDWLHVAINLSEYTQAGKAVKLRWEFRTNNGVQNGFEGVWVDEVRIETICPPKADSTFSTVCDKDNPCKAATNPCASAACTPFSKGKTISDKGNGICLYDMTPGCCVGVVDCDDKLDCTVDSCVKAPGAKPTDKGTCDNPPKASDIVCCQPKNLFTEKFELSTSAWSFSGNSTSVSWHHDTAQTAGGSKGAVIFGNKAGTGYGDGTVKQVQGRMCSKAIALPIGTQYDLLSFQLKMATEWSGQPVDKYKNPPCPNGVCNPSDPKLDLLRVLIKTGGKLHEAWSSDAVAGTTEGKWMQIKANLDMFQGKTVELCFDFDTGDAYGNDKGGIWIDDVSVDVACVQEECTVETAAVDCKGKVVGKCDVPICSAGKCAIEKKAGCCETDKDCDDANSCTADTCLDGACQHDVKDPKCCAPLLTKDGNPLFYANFETTTAGGELPPGWTAQGMAGQPELGGQYSSKIKWNITTLKAKVDPNATPPTKKSLYFGKDGLFDAGGEVPAGVVDSPIIDVPANGTHLVSFDLFMSVEWNLFPWKDPPPPFAIDQLQLHVIDTGETDPTKAVEKIWDSYAIEGSTKGKWGFVVVQLPAKYAGKKIRLRLAFDAGTTSKNTGEGAYVDNLTVETLCTAPACVADSECPKKPATPDKCKKYWCGKDSKNEFACMDEWVGGEGCCAPSLALPLETLEGGKMDKWIGFPPDPNDPTAHKVQWQVINAKHSGSTKEIYFGDSKTWNYAEGSGKTCIENSECTVKDEKCSGEAGKKQCFGPVDGKLTSAEIDISPDPKKGLEFSFDIYADIEASFESFEVWVLEANGVAIESVWNHETALAAKGLLKKNATQKIDLIKYKSKGKIKLEFRFDSKDGGKNQMYEGIFLDNLKVEETCL